MVLNKRIRRVLLANKAQYLGSIVLIFLSAYVFTMMNQFAANFARLVDEFQINHAQEDAAFTTDSLITNLSELEAAGDARIEEGLTLDFTLAEGQTLRIFSEPEKVNIPAILEGTDLNASGDILLGQYFATANGYQIGDQLTIEDRPFTVVGFMTQPNFMYPVQSESDLLPQPGFGTAIINREDFTALDQAIMVYAVRFNGRNQNIIARSVQFRELLSSNGVNVRQWTEVEDNRRVSIVRAEVQILNLVSKVVPTVILLLATVMVCNVVWRMISRESTIIGALYALGYKRQEIYRHYLIFPLLIAIVGGIIGTIAGTFLVRFMVLFFVSVFIVPLTGIELNPLVMVISPLLPIVLLGVSGYLVIRSTLKHSPVELMHGKENENQVNFLERALRLERFPFGIKFAIRQQLRSLSRVAFLLIGIAVATLLLLWSFLLKTSTDFLVEGIAEVYDFEYEYVFPELRDEPVPAGAEPISAALFLPDAASSKDFHITGVLTDSAMITLVDDSGAPLRTDQVIATRPLADQLHVSAGESITIVRKLDGRAFMLNIDRVAENYGGNFIFMPLETYNETFEMPEGSYTGIFSNTLLDIPETEPYSLVTLDEKVAGAQELIAIVAVMMGVIAVIAFGIGMIVIYVVTTLLVEENKDIISLMKVFGYRKQEINALILNSSTFVVVIGYLIGIPLTISAVGAYAQLFADTVGLTLPPATLSLPYLLIGLVVVMLCFELSKRLCRRKVAAVSMSESLKLATE